MSILVDENTKVLIQGITGKQGRYHTKKMLDYNVKLLAGVSPGKEGEKVEGVPVYDSVKRALDSYKNINASMILVPPRFTLNAVIESIEAGIRLVVIITEHVPVHDTLKIVKLANEYETKIIGPNTIGVISPGKSMVGIMPGYIYSQGRIGIISRSGTLTHEISSNLTFRGYGQSTCIGIGGDPIIGINHKEALELFRSDAGTKVIILIGEIGGVGEELAAKYIKENGYPKPIYAYIAGRMAPEGKKMGHAGAIVSGNMGSAKSKIDALTEAGVKVANTLDEILVFIDELQDQEGDLK